MKMPAWLLPGLAILMMAQAAAAELRIGSKRFTESYILGEIVAQAARSANEDAVVHRRGLGNTAIVLGALESGEIDVYPEYTGTIAREILKLDTVPSLPELNLRLAPMGLAAAIPLGFNNSYALALSGDAASAMSIATIADLAAHPGLRLGLSQEFLGRADGWPGLKARYLLPFATPRGLDHGLAYEAMAAGQIDVIDVYSTDAKIDRYGLRLLTDDRGYFPRYDAVLLFRAGLPLRAPRSFAALRSLEGSIDATRMRAMNAEAELAGKDFGAIAADFLRAGTSAKGRDVQSPSPPNATFMDKLFGPYFWRLTGEHLGLVFFSLAASVVLGIPLGVLAARTPGLRGTILGSVGVIQTLPALAVLAMLIPLTGRIGPVPAFIALVLYALLPIVRNTFSGLNQIPQSMKQAAAALGLGSGTILVHIELPLAGPTILTGIRTSAVIGVGTATIAAFVGAGGFGERIVTGLALNDNATLLAGALPAAALALLIEGGFNLCEYWIVPEGLRPPPGR